MTGIESTSRLPKSLLTNLATRLAADWQAIETESAQERQSLRLNSATRGAGPLIVASVAALCISIVEEFGQPKHFGILVSWLSEQLMEQAGPRIRAPAIEFSELLAYAWWSGCRLVMYVGVPSLLIKRFYRRSLVEFGFGRPRLVGYGWAYVLLFAVVFVAMLLATRDEQVQHYYPMYNLASRSVVDLCLWEILYAAQFIAVEFFFRGFLLKACKATLGANAIAFMLVPYCMIHFSKPYLEVLGSIPIGIILGFLAMRTSSVWSGVVVHAAIGTTMDLLVLTTSHRLPIHLWPAGVT